MMVRCVGALLLGSASVFGFAPFGVSVLPLLTLCGLFALWYRESSRDCWWTGLAFGLGLFGTGTSWIYVALASFGGMPVVLACIATAAFCAFLALFPAVTGWLAASVAPAGSPLRLALAAACWTLTEWLRGWIFSGFPWLSFAHAQVTGPLAGYAPIGGAYLVGLVLASLAALVVFAAMAMEAGRHIVALGAVFGIALLWVAGVLLSRIEWTQTAGEPVTVSLVQGNISQDIKFDAAFREKTLAIYADLVARSRGQLTVLPESALPMFADEVPVEYFEQLRKAALRRDGDVLVGLFYFEPGADADRYFNSVVSLGAAPLQMYRKHHLVPFGETIPAKPVVGWFIHRILHIPLADQTPGSADQPAVRVSGQRVAVNICYEDAFGAELVQRAEDATLLVNVTNDAWYGHSLAAEQHAQISAMRALEAGRPMLRATNTGITSIIDHHGRERARLPWFTRGILEGEIAGRTGTTPYAHWRDGLALALATSIAMAAALVARRQRGSAPTP